VIPPLPTDAVRRALDAGEWDTATDLLGEHEREVRETIAARGVTDDTRASWLALLSAQRALLSQLRDARSETARTLQRFGRERRGVDAYRSSGQ
jgi:hypothetical protein